MYTSIMVRASTKTIAPSAAAATPAADPVKAVKTPKAPAAPKAAATPKAAKTVDVAVDAAPVVEGAEVTSEVVPEENSVATAMSKVAGYGALLAQLSTYISTLKNEYKALEKVVGKELKIAQKVSNRKSKRSGNRKPSGFVRPTLISVELAQFLDKPAGSEMARTEVSKEINNYIRTNKLQDEKNGRQINADPKLIALLKLQAGDSLTYFNLQRYMKHHFVKPVVAVV